MVKISELVVRQGNADVEGTIQEVGEIKTFNKFGRELRVADAILKDDSGSVKLTLWNDDATRFKSGDKVKISNGFVNEFQGEKQLTSGKFGKIEKVGASEETENSSEEMNEESNEEPDAEDSSEEMNEESNEEPDAEDSSEEMNEESNEEPEEIEEEVF